MVKIHQAGDHQLDEVRAAGNRLVHQRAIAIEILVGSANERAIAPLAADGKARRAVFDAVFRRELRRPARHAQLVAAVAQIAHARRGVIPQPGANPVVLHLLPMPPQRPAKVLAVQRHVHMAVSEHDISLLPKAVTDLPVYLIPLQKAERGAHLAALGLSSQTYTGRYIRSPPCTTRTSKGRSS